MKHGNTKPEIAYLVPGLFLSGGISAALHQVYELQKRGRSVAVFCTETGHDSSWCHFISELSVYPFADYYKICGETGATHIVASWWETAFDVATIAAENKHYFLQSIESRLFEDSHPFHHAFYLTLLLGLNIFTEAKWIRAWLKEELSITAALTPNGLDLDLFKPQPVSEPRKKFRVLIEGSTNSFFKGVRESFEAIKGLDLEVWYVSPDDKPDPEWRIDKFFNAVPLSKMPEIYSQCDVLLKLSSVEGVFGPPLEMMACGGTCVVGRVTGADEYCVDGENCLMVDLAKPEDARVAVEKLMDDPNLLNRLKAGGLKTAANFSWSKTADLLEQEVFDKVHEPISLILGPTVSSSLIDIKRHLGNNLQMRLSLDEFQHRCINLTAEVNEMRLKQLHVVHVQERLDAVEAQWQRDLAELNEIRGSVGWRFLQKCYKIRDCLLRRKTANSQNRKIE
ncbi:MAG: glycosyltransferase family 4 protein [Lentisphaerae bacterium]|nr:glycosyltransferase family 4 protein [Lentisphaerota bacterium]